MKAAAFVSISRAAERLGVSKQRVYQWIRAGRLRAVHAGERAWIVSEREIERMKGERAATSKATGSGEAEQTAQDSRPGPLPPEEVTT